LTLDKFGRSPVLASICKDKSTHLEATSILSNARRVFLGSRDARAFSTGHCTLRKYVCTLVSSSSPSIANSISLKVMKPSPVGMYVREAKVVVKTSMCLWLNRDNNKMNIEET